MRPADLDRMVAPCKDLAGRELELHVLGIARTDGVNLLLAEAEDDAPDVPPVDRARAHRTGLGAGEEGAATEEVAVEAGGRHPYEVRLGVSRHVLVRSHGVLCLEHDIALRVHQQRAEGMVAVLSCQARKLDRAAEKLPVAVAHRRRRYRCRNEGRPGWVARQSSSVLKVPALRARATHSVWSCRRRSASFSGAITTCSLIACSRWPQSGQVDVAGFLLCARRDAPHSV